ncbi:MAG: hypothetical protein LLF98_11115 [Clostridium sp.]|uniref:hypothetical protein n=1 Tax=Clostridium sp. TaxID=1506 RepID=UPI0025BA6287|nr:hypothetical protein [Clostridium sp.]MCE5221779.1 hypothetical protein [Clostridium sp.]
MEKLPELQVPSIGYPKGRKNKKTKIKIFEIDRVLGKECTCKLHEPNSEHGWWLPLTEFYERGKGKYQPICKICSKKIANINKRRKWYYYHLKRTIYTGKKRGLDVVDIDRLDKIVRQCWIEQKGKDFFTEESIKLGMGTRGNNGDVFSIDRINSNLGYISGNICITTNDTNTKMKARLEYYIRKYGLEKTEKIIFKMLDGIKTNS